MKNIYEVESSNKIKSAIIIVLFSVFVLLAVYIFSNAFGYYLGYEVGGIGYVGIALIVSGISSFVGYWWSDKMVLAISGARPADRKRDFLFYTVAENLSIAIGIATPKLYVIEDSAPNAFATGRGPEHSVICVTTGLLSKLNRTELEGVVAHEMTHIKNYDVRLMSVVSVMVGIIALLADWFLRASFFGGGKRDNDESKSIGAIFVILGLVFAILSPLIAQLIKLAVSRQREYMADSGAVSITRQPSGLIGALKKISGDMEPLEAANKATAHLYIVNPFKDNSGGKRAVDFFSGLFNTHPPIAKRIAELEKMA